MRGCGFGHKHRRVPGPDPELGREIPGLASVAPASAVSSSSLMPSPSVRSLLREHILDTIDAVEAILNGPYELADVHLQSFLHRESAWLDGHRPDRPADEFLFRFHKDAITDLTRLCDASMSDPNRPVDGTEEVLQAIVKVVDQRALMNGLVGDFLEADPSPS
jgi:hypothetical protein